MKYFSLFSGIGGFELGILYALCGTKKYEYEKAIGQCQRQRRLESDQTTRLACVGFSEIDKYATQVYKNHFPAHKEYGNVQQINWNDVENFELLVGGFPCQSFSIAGKRKGFDDTRGTLFFEIARAAQEKQPRLLLLENVKGLLSHDKGRTFGTILHTLDELGYDLQWQVLNSKNFGVPQNRERVFIVGHLRGTDRPQVFPLRQTNEVYPTDNNRKVAKCLDSNYHKGWLDYGQRTMIKENNFQIKTAGYINKKHECNAYYKIDGIIPTLRAKAGGQTRGRAIETINTKIRRLTPIECERLQGFPDGWTIGISDTQRYKCLGNAVTVNVVQAIAERLL